MQNQRTRLCIAYFLTSDRYHCSDNVVVWTVCTCDGTRRLQWNNANERRKYFASLIVVWEKCYLPTTLYIKY